MATALRGARLKRLLALEDTQGEALVGAVSQAADHFVAKLAAAATASMARRYESKRAQGGRLPTRLTMEVADILSAVENNAEDYSFLANETSCAVYPEEEPCLQQRPTKRQRTD